MNIPSAIKLLTSQLARQLTLVLTGNTISAGIGLFAVLIISKSLTVHDFGLFNIAISLVLIVQPLANFGMNTSMMKFTSSYLGAGKTHEACQVLKTAFYIKTFVSFILAVLVFNTSGLLSKQVFHQPLLAPLFEIASFGILMVSMFNYVKGVLHAYKKFTDSVAIQLFMDLAKLLTVGLLLVSSKLNPSSAVMTFAFIPITAILLGIWQMRHNLSFKKKHINNLFSRLFSFSKWIFISTLCRRTFLYIGIFMLARMVNTKAAGIYGLALYLTRFFSIIIVSLTSVLLPEVLRFRKKEQLEKYVRGSLKISLSIAIACAPLIFISKRIILFFFGPRYLETTPAFNWLLLSFIFFAISSILRPIVLLMNKPHILANLNIISVVVMVFGCYLLIPSFTILAPAVLSFIINGVSLGFLTIYIFQQIQRRKIILHPEEEDVEPEYSQSFLMD